MLQIRAWQDAHRTSARGAAELTLAKGGEECIVEPALARSVAHSSSLREKGGAAGPAAGPAVAVVASCAQSGHRSSRRKASRRPAGFEALPTRS